MTPKFLSLVMLAVLSLTEARSQRSIPQAFGSIALALSTDTTTTCDTGLTHGGVHITLEYRQVNLTSEVNHSRWERLGVVNIPSSESNRCQHHFSFNFSYMDRDRLSSSQGEGGQTGEELGMQFRLVQWEHGGGYCNCWALLPDSLLVDVEGSITRLEFVDW